MKNVVKIGRLAWLDQQTNELQFLQGSNAKIKVEPQVSQLISIIVTKDAISTRDELIDLIWNGNEGVGNTALTKNIYKIRKVFEENGVINPIETIPKKGYRLSTKSLLGFRYAILMKPTYVIGLLIVGIVVLKIINPGIFHFIAHRLLH